jgi:hypothetical protein
MTHQVARIALSAALFGVTAFAAERGDIVIDDTAVYPESVTSTSGGDVFTGSMKGIIYRARKGESRATAWIRPGDEVKVGAVFGVLADEKSKTLWACTAVAAFQRGGTPVPPSLVAYDLESGKYKASYAFLAPGVCNDIAVARDGSVYATDTPNGRILKLSKGGTALQLFAQDDRLKGIDGIVFSGSGVMYVNIVTSGALMRVDLDKSGALGALTELKVSQALGGPDGFRLISGDRFLLAEGTAGRIDEVTIKGDAATVRVLREGLNSSPGVTHVGNTVYAIEGKIKYLIDPQLRGQDPGEFRIHAIPLK